jgi:hypothetical protein
VDFCSVFDAHTLPGEGVRLCGVAKKEAAISWLPLIDWEFRLRLVGSSSARR